MNDPKPVHPKWLRRLPNQLTWLRVACIPIVVYFLLRIAPVVEGQPVQVGWYEDMAALIFACAAFTDFFDGYIARRFGVETILGKLLDPLADKLLHVSAMIILVEKHRMAGWIACLLIVRDLAINAIRMSAMEEGLVIPSNNLAKWKSTFLDVAIVGLILEAPLFVILPSGLIGNIALWLALAASMGSAAIYLLEYAKRLRAAG